MLLTTTDRVAIAFGRTDQRWLSVVGVEELRAHLHDGEFGAGSMAPKIEAAIRFVDAPGPGAASRTAVITSPELLMAAVRGDADVGTRIVRSAVDAPIR